MSNLKVNDYALIIRNKSGVLFSESGSLEELKTLKAEYDNSSLFKAWIVQVVETPLEKLD